MLDYFILTDKYNTLKWRSFANLTEFCSGELVDFDASNWLDGGNVILSTTGVSSMQKMIMDM
jgi:hypothetical protein